MEAAGVKRHPFICFQTSNFEDVCNDGQLPVAAHGRDIAQ